MGNTGDMTGHTGDEADDQAVDALFVGAPEDFIAARDALAKAAAPADRAAIKALRRPTVAGWVVNQLVRTRRETVEELLDIGRRLRSAQTAGHGDELRTLATERRLVTDALIGAAREIVSRARGGTMTAELQAAVASSLDAAVADAGLAVQLRSGRLTDALSYAGFGAAALMSVPPGEVSAPASADQSVAPTTSGRLGGAKAAAAAAAAATGAAADRRRQEAADRRRQETAATAAAARAARRAADERLRLAEHALSDARMNLDLARRAEKAADAALDRLDRQP